MKNIIKCIEVIKPDIFIYYQNYPYYICGMYVININDISTHDIHVLDNMVKIKNKEIVIVGANKATDELIQPIMDAAIKTEPFDYNSLFLKLKRKFIIEKLLNK